MKVNPTTYAGLTPAEIAAWSRLQQADPACDSPYFRPEFVRAVAAVRDDVEVAVLEDGGKPVGFFPFQRKSRKVAEPVGFPTADFQGAVVAARLDWAPCEVLRGCGLAAWSFDHVPAAQRAFLPYAWRTAISPYLDLSRGFDAYRADRKSDGTRKIAKTLAQGRKLAAEVGPLRLVPHTGDAAIFRTVMDWKRAQYRATRVPDTLAAPWKQALLQQVVATQGEGLAGMLSALFAGDRLVAVHLGMRSGGVLHGWFPAYNPEFAKYSPGAILWIELAKAAAELGIRRIDLGRGSEGYKLQFMSGAIPLVEGRVDNAMLMRGLYRGWHGLRNCVRATPLRKPAQAVMRALTGRLAGANRP
jgi:CelD/BcsL family acetyltransferase involved in cellulose biosynthesis